MLIEGNIQPFTIYEYIDDKNNLYNVAVYCFPVKRSGMMDKTMPNDFYLGKTITKRKAPLTGNLEKKLYKRLKNIEKNHGHSDDNNDGSVRGFQVGDDFSNFTTLPLMNIHT